MAQLASDNFSGTSLSANWTILEGGFTVSSGAVTGTSGVDSTALYNAVSFPNDQYSQAECSDGDTANDFAGVGVRVSGTSSADISMYRFQLSGYESNTPQLTLDKFVNGTYTALVDSGSTYYHLSAGKVYYIEAVGTTINCYLGGTKVLTTTDSSLSSGAAAICTSESGSGSNIKVWTAGSSSAAPAPRPKDGGFFFGSLGLAGLAAIIGRRNQLAANPEAPARVILPPWRG